MPLARWKDLCLDATAPKVLGAFWATALSREMSVQDGGDAVLSGATPEDTIWVNAVPEPKTVKNRVHPDLRDDLGRLLAIGATVLRAPDDEISWHVLADPEGNEFCCFPRRPDHPEKDGFYELVVDADDPAAEASWWAEVLGATEGDADGVPWRWVEDAPGTPFQYLVFNPVPEPKTVKNRWHWDVACDDIDGLLAKGATLLRRPDDVIRWHVLADPEGNEFCVFAT
jgi:catechol 2,3-dioxygenase-like lactoylglutathione lyase family enzyme